MSNKKMEPIDFCEASLDAQDIIIQKMIEIRDAQKYKPFKYWIRQLFKGFREERAFAKLTRICDYLVQVNVKINYRRLGKYENLTNINR